MKYVRIILLVLVLILAGTGFLQWRHYRKQLDLRREGLLYFSEEDYAKAIDYLEEAIGMRSVFSGDINTDMKEYLAESYMKLNENDKAVALYDDLIREDPAEVRHYVLKSECLTADENEEEAREVLRRGYEKTGDSGLLLTLCERYLADGDYEQALDCAAEGSKAGGGNEADFLFAQVVIYEKQGDYQSALEACKEYTDKYPDDEKGQKEYIFLSTR